MNNKNKKLLAKLALFLVALLWGTSMTVVNDVTEYYPTGFILGVRFIFSALILAIIFYKRLKLSVKSDWLNGSVIGILLFGAYYIQTLAVFFTTPGRSSILAATYCIIIPFIVWAVNRVRPDKFNFIAAFICLIGVVLIGQSGSEINLSANIPMGKMFIGDAIALFSGFIYAAQIFAINKLGANRDSIVITIIQFLIAGIISWAVSLTTENYSLIDWNIIGIAELIYLVIFCTCVALLLQNIFQHYCEPTEAGIILGTESVFGVLFPVALGIESITLVALLGCISIVIAIFIAETKLKFLFPNADNYK